MNKIRYIKQINDRPINNGLVNSFFLFSENPDKLIRVFALKNAESRKYYFGGWATGDRPAQNHDSFGNFTLELIYN